LTAARTLLPAPPLRELLDLYPIFIGFTDAGMFSFRT
jgi:hypothetical protein